MSVSLLLLENRFGNLATSFFTVSFLLSLSSVAVSAYVCMYEGVTYRAIYRGNRYTTQPRVIFKTLSPPPLHGLIFGASESYTYVCTLTYPLRFTTTWGDRETCVCSSIIQARASVSIKKETFEF